MYRVFLVEDHPVVREGYASLIEREPDLVLCGEAGSGPDAIDRIPKAAPDLALVDISLPQMSGLELIKNLSTIRPEMTMLVVSAHNEALYAERALRAGAQGYIMKHEPVPRLLDAIRTVLRGDLYLSEHLRTSFHAHRLKRPASLLDVLSDRELEVFEYLGRGLTTRQIAEAMMISVKTVETHRANIKQKLDIESLPELLQRAVVWVEAR